MYDNWSVADPDDLAHKTKYNWSVIAQKGNNCVREYELDKMRYAFDQEGNMTNRIVRSQAFIMYDKSGKSVYVLQIWPIYRPLRYLTEVINQRRAKMGRGNI